MQSQIVWQKGKVGKKQQAVSEYWLRGEVTLDKWVARSFADTCSYYSVRYRSAVHECMCTRKREWERLLFILEHKLLTGQWSSDLVTERTIALNCWVRTSRHLHSPFSVLLLHSLKVSSHISWTSLPWFLHIFLTHGPAHNPRASLFLLESEISQVDIKASSHREGQQ